MWDTILGFFMVRLSWWVHGVGHASGHSPVVFSSASCVTRALSTATFTYAFINLPSVWVYRSPQRNKYCRGPILAYWPRELSAHEFLLKRKTQQSINQSVPFSLAPLSDNLPFGVSEVKQPKQFISAAGRRSFSFTCPFFLSKSAPVSSGLSTRRHVGNFCSHQLKTSPTPKDAPVTDGSPVRPHSSDTSAAPTAGKRIPSSRGTSCEMKGGDGIQSGGEQLQRCSTAQPLLSTPLPWEKLTGG